MFVEGLARQRQRELGMMGGDEVRGMAEVARKEGGNGTRDKKGYSYKGRAGWGKTTDHADSIST